MTPSTTARTSAWGGASPDNTRGPAGNGGWIAHGDATAGGWRHQRGVGSVEVRGMAAAPRLHAGPVMLLGRFTERAALGQLVEAARGGRSGALVVHGEAGVGKTALLVDVIASAAGMRVARVAGIESEMELAYAALQQLCAQLLDGLDRLPDPQREALGVAFGLRAGRRRTGFWWGWRR